VRIDDALLRIGDRLVHERAPILGTGYRCAHGRKLYQRSCHRAFSEP
jgi:hypothetical protein